MFIIVVSPGVYGLKRCLDGVAPDQRDGEPADVDLDVVRRQDRANAKVVPMNAQSWEHHIAKTSSAEPADRRRPAPFKPALPVPLPAARATLPVVVASNRHYHRWWVAPHPCSKPTHRVPGRYITAMTRNRVERLVVARGAAGDARCYTPVHGSWMRGGCWVPAGQWRGIWVCALTVHSAVTDIDINTMHWVPPPTGPTITSY